MSTRHTVEGIKNVLRVFSVQKHLTFQKKYIHHDLKKENIYFKQVYIYKRRKNRSRTNLKIFPVKNYELLIFLHFFTNISKDVQYIPHQGTNKHQSRIKFILDAKRMTIITDAAAEFSALTDYVVLYNAYPQEKSEESFLV